MDTISKLLDDERQAIADFVEYADKIEMVAADAVAMIRDGNYIPFMLGVKDAIATQQTIREWQEPMNELP